MPSLIDLHQDLSSAQYFPELREQTSFAQLESVDTKMILGTGFTLPEENIFDVIERDLSFYESWCHKNPQWSLITTKSDMEEIRESTEKRGILFHIEGFPDFNGEWNTLAHWYERGLRSAGLVWNDDNPLGGGTHSDNGITALGQEFISYCEEKGILIDLAHANQNVFKDCLDVIQKPPFISHGGLYSLVPNRRNFTDTQLTQVTERGGIVGVFFAKSCMARGNTFTIDDIVAHIAHTVDLLGEDGVAIGTDFGGMTGGTPEEMSKVSQIDKLWKRLAEKGVSERQIEKIAHKNAERYFCENLPNS